MKSVQDRENCTGLIDTISGVLLLSQDGLMDGGKMRQTLGQTVMRLSIFKYLPNGSEQQVDGQVQHTDKFVVFISSLCFITYELL